MTKTLLAKWPLIEQAAIALRIPDGTRRQWKSRGAIPHHTRLAIIRESGGMVAPGDFEAMDAELQAMKTKT